MLVHRFVSVLRDHTMIMETCSKCVAPMFCLHSHKGQHRGQCNGERHFFSYNLQIGGWDVKSRKAVSYHLKLLFPGFILRLLLVGFGVFLFVCLVFCYCFCLVVVVWVGFFFEVHTTIHLPHVFLYFFYFYV